MITTPEKLLVGRMAREEVHFDQSRRACWALPQRCGREHPKGRHTESFLQTVIKAPIEIWKLTVEVKVQAGQACRFGKGHITGSGSPEENQKGMDVLSEHSTHLPE